MSSAELLVCHHHLKVVGTPRLQRDYMFPLDKGLRDRLPSSRKSPAEEFQAAPGYFAVATFRQFDFNVGLEEMSPLRGRFRRQEFF
jgi:hypothetical protein